jgi:hypothetical protein
MSNEPLGPWFLENFIGPFLKWCAILYGGALIILILVVVLYE